MSKSNLTCEELQCAIKHIITETRSIRSYKDELIPKNIINEILSSVSHCPSTCYTKPWELYVSDNKNSEFRLKLKEKEILHPKYAKFGYDAPLLIFACAENTTKAKLCDTIMNGWVQNYDCRLSIESAIACDYMRFTAFSHGIYSCHIGAIDRKKAGELLSLNENCHVVLALSFGYPNEKPKYHKLKEISDISKWV